MRQVRYLRNTVFALFFLAALLCSSQAWAQSVTGALQGAVRDANGAVIPNADIKARNVETGTELTTTSNAEGLYRFASVLPGQYTLSISANGFKRSDLTNVTVGVGAVATLDAALQTGSVQEVVEISSEQTVVETETAQISNNFSSKQILNIPVNIGGGGIDTLALLTPGVVGGVGGGFGNQNGTTIFSNGGRSRSNNFNIDGQDNNDLTVTGPATFINNQDAVGEFQIISNGFSAEFGQAGGSVVNILTKSGTNQFHGTAAYFYRNRKLFETLTNQERRSGRKEAPALTNQTFSYTIGGPILKDRLHFFNSYLGQRQPAQALAQSGPNGFSPTPAGIQTLLGIPGLSPAAAAAARRLAPFNVAVGNPVIQPNPSNVANLRPTMVPITVGAVTRDVEFAPIQRQVAAPFTENQYQTRVDWDINDKSRLFGTHFYQKQIVIAGTGVIANGFFGDVPSASNRVGVTHIYTLNTRMVNEFRFSYADIEAIFGGNQMADITAADQDVTNLAFGAGFLGWGTPVVSPQGRLNRNYQYVNNFSLSLGNHRTKLGLDFRSRKSDLIFLPNANGAYSYAIAGATNAWSFFAQNSPTQVSLTLGPIGSKLKDFQHYYFFQDDWKVRPNLTLNLGVRYENFGQPINQLHEATLARESNAQTAFYNTNIPVEARIVPKLAVDNNNWGPRVGFAWSPNSSGWLKHLAGNNETVVRGGFALAYDLAFYNILLNMQTFAPVVLASALPRGAGVVLPNEPTGPAVRQALQPLVPFRTLDPRALNRTTVSSDFHSPYTMQWSLGIQRQVGRHHGLEVGYVATRALQQFRTINGNPLIAQLFADFPNQVPNGVRPVANNHPVAISRGRVLPGEGLNRLRDNGAVANFHSMQAQYTARFGSLASTVNYTLGKQTDTGTDVFGTAVGQTIAQNPFDLNAGEKARGFLDFRHILSLSVVYQVPVFKDQRGVLGHALGGWQISGTYRALPGQPFAAQQANFGSPYNDTPFGLNFVVADGGLRPFRGNVNADPRTVGLDDVTARARFANLFNANTPVSQYYLLNDLNNGRVTPVTANDVRFIANTLTSARRFGSPWGTEPRNSLIGDDLRLGNFSLFKNTKLARGFYKDSSMTLQFRFDMFNVFNNTNLGLPNFSVDNAGRGFADITEGNNGDGAAGRRRVNFSLKLIF
jgi:hypothetical protein